MKNLKLKIQLWTQVQGVKPGPPGGPQHGGPGGVRPGGPNQQSGGAGPQQGGKQNRITTLPKPVGIDPVVILQERENR